MSDTNGTTSTTAPVSRKPKASLSDALTALYSGRGAEGKIRVRVRDTATDSVIQTSTVPATLGRTTDDAAIRRAIVAAADDDGDVKVSTTRPVAEYTDAETGQQVTTTHTATRVMQASDAADALLLVIRPRK